MKYLDYQSDPVAGCASKRRESDRISRLTAGSALDERMFRRRAPAR
jgi:hypothetical protein